MLFVYLFIRLFSINFAVLKVLHIYLAKQEWRENSAVHSVCPRPLLLTGEHTKDDKYTLHTATCLSPHKLCISWQLLSEFNSTREIGSYSSSPATSSSFLRALSHNTTSSRRGLSELRCPIVHTVSFAGWHGSLNLVGSFSFIISSCTINIYKWKVVAVIV